MNVFTLSVQADVFIPQWLRDIQTQQQTLQRLPATSPFPPASYVRGFLPQKLAEDLCKPSTSNILTSPPVPLPLEKPLDPLTQDTYEEHFTTLLAWELDNLAKDKEDLVLWKMSLKAHDLARSEFVLEVAGLRENYPRLDIGDLAHLRTIIEDAHTGTGQAFEARVIALRKREGLVRMSAIALLRARCCAHIAN